MPDRVVIVKWAKHDGIAAALGIELGALGYPCEFVMYDGVVPADVGWVFTFAPYNRFLQIPQQLAERPAATRPFWIHWSTENLPNPEMAWGLLNGIASARSALERGMPVPPSQPSKGISLLSLLQERMIRFRNTGDYFYARDRGWIDLFVESSAVFAEFYRAHGLSTLFVPWGSVPSWYGDLGLDRDIDVLWMGSRRTRRRSGVLEQIRKGLAQDGYTMYVADGREHPFIYGPERTRFLNRTKITLSVLPEEKHDNVMHFRFHLAAPHRSLLVTERELAHCSTYQAGTHFVAAPADALIETLKHYLRNEAERNAIIENAYALSTTQMTFGASVRAIMREAEKMREQKKG